MKLLNLIVVLILFSIAVNAQDAQKPPPKEELSDPSQVIEYVSLDSRNQLECASPGAAGNICRLRQTVTVAEAHSKLHAGQFAWHEGDRITFAYRGQAESVTLFGPKSLPLSPIKGTELWVLTARIPQIEKALFGYQFLIQREGKLSVEPKTPIIWRGPLAPPAPPRVEALEGKIVKESIESVNLAENRAITLYVPHLRRGQKIQAVVYMADGESVPAYASLLETLITAGRLPPTLIVGIHAGQRLPGSDPRASDLRALEYLIGFGETNARFEAHEKFVINEVIPWAESKFGAPRKREKRVVFGASNGGSFAMAMGIRNPEIFGHAINFSGAARGNFSLRERQKGKAATFYLFAGSLEPETVYERMKSWAETLQTSKIPVVFTETVSGHDSSVWVERFPEALVWSFKKQK